MFPTISRLARAAALALSLAAAPAMAQDLVLATDGQAVASLIQGAGYQAQLERTDEGHPRIRSSSDGLNYTLYFLGCANNPACRAVQFQAGFRMNTPPTIETINEWNRTRNIGHAYLGQDGQPRVAFFVPMEGGISRAAFDYAFRSWRTALSDYVRHIGFQR